MTVATTLNKVFIYKANYNNNMFSCRAYKPSESSNFHGDIFIDGLPDNMKEEILKEII